MNWLDSILDSLARQPAIGYLPGGAVAAEPTAIAALALAAHGRTNSARKAAAALAEIQGDNGAVGIRTGEPKPGCPTSLAVAAWSAMGKALRGTPDAAEHAPRISRGVSWLLANRGRALERSPEFGHNTQLVGWAYAEQTHSWVEPTALAVLALKAAGRASDPA